MPSIYVRHAQDAIDRHDESLALLTELAIVKAEMEAISNVLATAATSNQSIALDAKLDTIVTLLGTILTLLSSP